MPLLKEGLETELLLILTPLLTAAAKLHGSTTHCHPALLVSHCFNDFFLAEGNGICKKQHTILVEAHEKLTSLM